MRDYAKIGPKFWIGPTGKKLRAAGMEAQIVGMYLMTSPHANMLGLYFVSRSSIAGETGLGEHSGRKGLQCCIDAGFCSYDDESEMVWVHEMAFYQIADKLVETDKRTVGVQNEYDGLLENPFLGAFFDKYQDPFKMKSSRGGIINPIEGPYKAHRSQEQEQAQEQDQEQEQAHKAIARAVTAVDLSIAMRAAGVLSQPADPRLIALAAQGVQPETAAAACEKAKGSKPNQRISPAYIFAILEGWASDAAKLKVSGAAAPKSGGTWWASDTSILAKGLEVGLSPRPGERMPDFKARIQARIDGNQPPSGAPPPVIVVREAEPKRVKPPGIGKLSALVGQSKEFERDHE